MNVFHKSRQHARKPYSCWWCGERILKYDLYDRWRYSGGECSTVRCHVVCSDVWSHAATHADDAYDYRDGVMYGEHSMGCLCERGACRCGTLRRLYREAFPQCQFCPEPERDTISTAETTCVHHIWGRRESESWWNFLTACHECHIVWAHQNPVEARVVAERVKDRLAADDPRHQIPDYRRWALVRPFV